MSVKARLEAELAHVRALLAEIPAERFFERMGLESRVRRLEIELRPFLQEPVHPLHAKVAILFGGDPVVGTRGIDARFATEALRKYQDFVSKVFATMLPGGLSSSGPVPLEEASHLHITDLPRGSFGFQLEELSSSGSTLFPNAQLAIAVEHANTIIEATSQSDDAFADALEEVGEVGGRVHSALHGFLSVVKNAGATFSVKSRSVTASLDVDRVRIALDRAEAERTEEVDTPVPGEFLGILLHSGRFEHRMGNGQIIGGRVVRGREPADFVAWIGKRCVAHVRTVTYRKSGREWKRYALLRVESSDATTS